MLGRSGSWIGSGGSISPGTYLEVTNNLSDVLSPGDSRTNLGFTTHTAGRVLLGDGSTTSADDALLFFDTTSKALSVNLAAAGTGATLDVGGIVGGIGFPVVTTAERDLIAPARNGVMLYNSTTHTFSGFQNGAWVNLGDHGTLAGLADDDHTQYALLAGRSGGQTINGDTDSGGNLTLSSTAHATKGKILLGTLSAYDQVNDRIGIGTTSPSSKLHLAATGATETLLTLDPTSGGNFEFGIQSGGLYIVQGSNTHFWMSAGWTAMGQAARTPKYLIDVMESATSTAPATDLIYNSGTYNLPLLTISNRSSTANNWSALAFAGSSTESTAPDSYIVGVHEAHTGSAESGHLEFYTRNAGTVSRKVNIAKDGVITMDSYTAGLSLFSGVGVISSLAAGAAGQVLYSNGTTWVAGARKEKAGKVDLTSGTLTKAITFVTPRADALYSPFWSFINTVDGDPVSIPYRIIAIATTGFTVEWDEELLTSDYDGYWGILEHYDP